MLIPDIANPFYSKVVRGAEDALRERGYSLLLGNTYDRVEEQSRYLRLFRSKQVDGVLLFIAPGDTRDIETFVRIKKPVVFVGRRPLSFDADSVTSDNQKGTRMAVERLIGAGHSAIGIITGQFDLSVSLERVDGWRRALKAAGLPTPKELVGEGDWTAESAQRITCGFLKAPKRPTAIFAANLPMMAGVLRALKEHGLHCPADIEVMCSDDSDWLDVFGPAISTVAQPSYEMGLRAAELLLKRIKSPGRRFEKIVLEPELVLRG
jgi:DNA-binding LacI/PurR family transcriptional regulator